MLCGGTGTPAHCPLDPLTRTSPSDTLCFFSCSTREQVWHVLQMHAHEGGVGEWSRREKLARGELGRRCWQWDNNQYIFWKFEMADTGPKMRRSEAQRARRSCLGHHRSNVIMRLAWNFSDMRVHVREHKRGRSWDGERRRWGGTS